MYELSSAVNGEKKLLRKQLSNAISLLPVRQIEEESMAVTEQILSTDWFKKAKRIGVYVSTQGEIITDHLIKHCLNDAQKQVFIPRFQRYTKEMEMLHLSSMKDFMGLEATFWNIRQHSLTDSEQKPPMAYDEVAADGTSGLDLVIVPGVAFTKKGDRLGHGKGHYDMFFSRYSEKFAREPMKIALSLRCQIFDQLPTLPHDVKMDLVIASKQSGLSTGRMGVDLAVQLTYEFFAIEQSVEDLVSKLTKVLSNITDIVIDEGSQFVEMLSPEKESMGVDSQELKRFVFHFLRQDGIFFLVATHAGELPCYKLSKKLWDNFCDNKEVAKMHDVQ